MINKVDLVTDEELSDLEDRLRHINATAAIVTSTYASVDLDSLLGVGAFDLSRTMAIDPHWLEGDEHIHDPSLSSVGIELPGELALERLDVWLTALLDRDGDDIFRMKGILAVLGDDRRFVLQGVHRMFETRPIDPWGHEPRSNRVVFIGRGLDRDALTAGIASCLSV